MAKKNEFKILASSSFIVGTPTATEITYGDALSASIISGITGTSAVGELSAAIDGIFAFTSASYIPDATLGSLYEITFTPTLSDFDIATVDVNVVVLSEITFTGTTSAVWGGTVALTADATGYEAEVDGYMSSFGTILSSGVFSWTPSTHGTFTLSVTALSGSDVITTGTQDIVVRASALVTDAQIALLAEYDASI